MSEAGAWYGAPAPPEEAGRTIQVTVDDDLRFSPDTYAVAAGEVVTFVVANVGRAEHEFVIGDQGSAGHGRRDERGQRPRSHGGDEQRGHRARWRDGPIDLAVR